MPYIDVTVQKTGYRTVQHSANHGYDPIPIHRPKFIFFEFVGLRPNIPHWIFFGNKLVTHFVNTSYSEADYTSASGGSVLKEPGDQFTNASAFPSSGSLTYSGPTAASGPINSDANGVLNGVFYLQSNTDYSWGINTDGHKFMAIDVSVPDKSKCKSYGTATFRGFGQYENYYTYTREEKYTYDETQQVWQEPANTTNNSPSSNPNTPNTKNDDGGNDKEMGWYQMDCALTGKTYNYHGDVSFGSHGWHMIKSGKATSLGVEGPKYGTATVETTNNLVAETHNEASNHADYGNAENSSSGEGSVLCSLLQRRGYLSEEVWRLDNAFGCMIIDKDSDIYDGYYAWAHPLVKWYERESVLSKIHFYTITLPLVYCWAKHIAHAMDPKNHKDNLIGRFLGWAGAPVCKAIGKFKNKNKKKNVSEDNVLLPEIVI